MNKKYWQFAVVGGIGFVVDLTTMSLLSIAMPLFTARCFAFFIAANSNWLLNRNITFAAQNSQTSLSLQENISQWTKFICSSCVGAIPNLVCYWGLITGFSLTGALAVFAIIPGILMGILVNFTLADRWVFQQP
ncbi:MAG: putative flippase GtrA [Moritella sp.]